MALAFGAIGTVGTSQNGDSGPTVSGANTVGVVHVNNSAGTDSISAVTWGGVSMTKIAGLANAGGGFISSWWIANPSSGGTIVFTGGSSWRHVCWYYTGAKQTLQPDSSNTGSNGSTNSLSVATTVVAANCWLVYSGADGSGSRTDTGSNQTPTVRLSADAGGMFVADSNATVSTGSQTATITISGGAAPLTGIAFSLAPAVTVVNSRMFFAAAGLM